MLPKVVWSNDNIRIVQIAKWDKDGLPIFIIEQNQNDVFGNDAWLKFIAMDIQKQQSPGTIDILWSVLNDFCNAVEKPEGEE